MSPSCADSIIVSIFRKGDRSDLKCFLVISLLDSPAKLISRALLQKLEQWATDNSILSGAQFGFKKGLGDLKTVCQPGPSFLEIYKGQSWLTIFIFADLNSAFDLIDLAQAGNVLTPLKSRRE